MQKVGDIIKSFDLAPLYSYPSVITKRMLAFWSAPPCSRRKKRELEGPVISSPFTKRCHLSRTFTRTWQSWKSWAELHPWAQN